MNQRILLPAIVIGTLFALLLTFVETVVPAAGLLPQFLLNAAGLCAALVAYGVLMQKAAAAAAAASANTSGSTSADTSARTAANASQRTPAAAAPARGAPAERKDAQRRDRSDRAEGSGASRAAPGRSGAARGTRPEPEAPTGPREEGHIKWFSGTKGFGFIIRGDGSEIFVHHRAIRGQARGDLPDGQPVSFVVVERDKGPQADQVDLLDGAAA